MIGGYAHEAEQRNPCEANGFGARQAPAPPLPSDGVYGRINIMCVNENVYVGQDYVLLAPEIEPQGRQHKFRLQVRRRVD